MSDRSPLKSLLEKNNSQLESVSDTCQPLQQVDSGFASCSNSIEASMRSSAEENSEPKNFLEKSTGNDLSPKNSGINDLKTKSVRQTRQQCPGSIVGIVAAAVPISRAEGKNSDVQEISKQPTDVFYKQGAYGDTQLHISILQRHVKVSMWLIKNSPNSSFLDILNDESYTALHLAVMCHDATIVRGLALAGANTELRTRNGNTALHLACTLGHLNCAKAIFAPPSSGSNPVRNALLNNTAAPDAPRLKHNLELRNYIGETCLYIAASKGHIDLVIHLVHSGARIDAQEGLGGRTALHIAVENRHYEIAHFLMDQGGPSINIMTYSGATAYQIACANGDHKLAGHLVRSGASPSIGRWNDDNDSSSDSSCEYSYEDDESDVSRQDLIFSKIVLNQSVSALVA